MDRLKNEFEIQLSRKIKRQSTFDNNRDLDQIVLERDNLRELCSTFRWLLSELAKCLSACEQDLNQTLFDELHRHGFETAPPPPTKHKEKDDEGAAAGGGAAAAENNDEDLNVTFDSQTSTASSKRIRFVPDVSGILDVIEDPSLLDYVAVISGGSKDSTFNLNDCVDRLKHEAMYLLELSENLCRKNRSVACRTGTRDEKDDSCEEEDGLKSKSMNKRKEHANSLNETLLSGARTRTEAVHKERLSLPTNSLFGLVDDNRAGSELTGQLNDLRNRLLISENDRQNLRTQLDDMVKKHDNLAEILNLAKDHLEHLEAQKEDIIEG